MKLFIRCTFNPQGSSPEFDRVRMSVNFYLAIKINQINEHEKNASTKKKNMRKTHQWIRMIIISMEIRLVERACLNFSSTISRVHLCRRRKLETSLSVWSSLETDYLFRDVLTHVTPIIAHPSFPPLDASSLLRTLTLLSVFYLPFAALYLLANVNGRTPEEDERERKRERKKRRIPVTGETRQSPEIFHWSPSTLCTQTHMNTEKDRPNAFKQLGEKTFPFRRTKRHS